MKQQMKTQIDSIVAEIGLIYKTKVAANKRTRIRTSAQAAHFFRNHWNPDTIELFEEMKVVYLNNAFHAVGLYTHSCGSMTATIADIRLILIAGLRLGALNFIICHSHPSGNLSPSSVDTQLTCKLKNAAALLDLELTDHIILTKGGYYSFKDEGLL